MFFNGELLERFEGDTMPSEEEFVATLDTRKRSGKVPVLEATEDQLKKFEPGKDKQAAAPRPTPAASLAAAAAELPAARSDALAAEPLRSQAGTRQGSLRDRLLLPPLRCAASPSPAPPAAWATC